MTKSLDQLLAYLLEEIALSGDTGLSFVSIVKHATTFYTTTETNLSISTPRTTFNIDVFFVKKLWQWLTRLDDLEVRPGNQLKKLTYNEVKAHLSGASASPDVAAHHDVRPSTTCGDGIAESIVAPEFGNIYIVATPERIYQAICGHGPDPARVFPSEYALLCGIAATRYDGILQGDLRQLTGQDKRSVPKRTDALQRKGYVEKRSVFVKGHKTSRLFLTRFSSREDVDTVAAEGNSYTIRDFARQIFAVLQEGELITQDELATTLSITDAAKKRVLQQVVRNFVRLNCLKKVRVARGQVSASTDIQVCIRVLHVPSDEEYVLEDVDYDPNMSMDNAITQIKQNLPSEDAMDDAGNDSDNDDSIDITSFKAIPTPQWNPQRNIANSLHDIVHNAGKNGCTNLQARQELTGLTVRRPVESMLTRISHGSLSSQSAAVKDMAIVRNWEVHNNVGKFVHRAFNQYESMVNSGNAEWSALQGYTKANEPNIANSSTAFIASQTRDKYGFVVRNDLKGQLKDANTTIDTVATAIIASNFQVRSNEPIVVTGPDGSFILDWNQSNDKADDDVPKVPKPARKKKPIQKSANPKRAGIITGRPRKFVRGTEKFWQEMFIIRYNEVHPDDKVHDNAGLPKDPDCLKMFHDRPAEMDDMIIKVIDHHLPTPIKSSDVSQEWVDRMKTYFNRDTADLVFVHTGMRRIAHRKKSCVVTIRSDRLKTSTSASLQPAQLQTTSLVDEVETDLDRTEQTPGPNQEVSNTKDPSSDISHIQPTSTPAPAVHSRTTKADEATGSRQSSPTPKMPVAKRRRLKTKNAPDLPAIANASSQEHFAIGSATHASESRELMQPSDGPRSRVGHTLEESDSSAEEPSIPNGDELKYDLLVMNRNDIDISTVNPLTGIFPGSVIDLNATTSVRSPSIALLPSLASSLVSSQSKESNARESIVSQDVSESQEFKPFSEAIKIALHGEEVDDMAQMNTTDIAEPEKGNGEKPSEQSHSPAELVIDQAAIDAGTLDDLTDKVPGAGQSLMSSFGPAAVVSRPSTPAARGVTVENPTSLPETPSRPTRSSQARHVDSQGDNDFETVRTKLLVGRDAVEYYRSFLVELVHLCGGLIPHNTSLLKRAMRVKCLETVVDPDMNIKLIKSGINILEKSKKVKVMHFAYQRKGFSHTKAILALPHIQPTDAQFRALQEKIISLPYQEDYVPAELQAEINRQPKHSERRDAHCEPSWSVSAAPTKKAKKKAQPTPRSESSIRRLSPESEELIAVAQSSEPEPKSEAESEAAHVSFLTLRVPRIAEIESNMDRTILDDNHLSNEPIKHAEGQFQSQPTEQTWSATENQAVSTSVDKSKLLQNSSQLPKSLKAILQVEQQQKDISEIVDVDNYALRIFERNVDLVARWEERNIDIQITRKSATWNFINHFTPASDTTPTQPHEARRFLIVTFVDDEEIENEAPRAVSWPAFAKLIKTKSRKRKRPLIQATSDVDERHFSHSEPEDAIVEDDQPRKRQKAGTKPPSRAKKSRAKVRTDAGSKKRARFNPRGIGMRYLEKDHAHKLGVSFALVRVLAGGIDRHVDFRLVKRLIPDESEIMLKERWKTLSNYYNNDMDALTADFQIKYLDALADDRVPSVDFDDLEKTDWEGIQAWALKDVNTQNKDLFRDLPPTREELLELNKVEVPEINTMRNYWNISVAYTMVQKEEAWCNAVLHTSPSVKMLKNVEPLVTNYETEQMEEDVQLALARSWILATMLTTRKSYDAKATHRKLRSLAKDEARCEDLLDEATKRLQADKTINRSEGLHDPAMAPDGSKLADNRGWRICSKFFDKLHLNRVITSSMIKGAAQFKLHYIDPAVASGEPLQIPKDPALSDGASLAIHNLIAMGMIIIRPGHDVPASRYGLDHENEGYKTRAMDKNILSFSTYLEPTPRYQMGDLLLDARQSTEIPRGEIDAEDGMGRIPVWFNINHQFMPAIWDLVIGAIIGIISVRPGLPGTEIVRSLGWALPLYDVELVLQYLLDCALISKVYNGWETTEWWWMCLDASQPEVILDMEAEVASEPPRRRTRGEATIQDIDMEEL